MSDDHLKIARTVLGEEAAAIVKLAESLDGQFSAAVEMILACKGKVILSGLGKSGIIARKISSTLASLGTTSVFVHAVEAFHGDLGVIGRDDVCILVSHSGKTEEVLKLVPVIRSFGSRVISMTADHESELAKVADVSLVTLVEAEACSLNLAPTTSTTATLALGDALAVALVEAKGFRPVDFARLHPGGSLGKRLLSRVSDAMVPGTSVGTAYPDTPVRELAEQMNVSNLGIVVVLNEFRELAGVVTDGDLRRALTEPDFMRLDAQAIMTKTPKVIHEDRLISEAIHFAEENRITALVVLDKNQKFMGVANLHDLIHYRHGEKNG